MKGIFSFRESWNLMEWQKQFSPELHQWCVYKVDVGQRILEKTFDDEESAERWALEQEKNFETPPSARPDVVEEASFESFPASDPPGWIDGKEQ